MFFVKKLVSSFLMPMPMVMGLIAAGLALLWFTKRQRLGKILVTSGLSVFFLTGCDWFGELALAPLESRYPALFVGATPTDADRTAANARFIVVLGSGHHSDARRPPTEQLSWPGTRRLLEGLRLHQRIPGAKLVVSGWGGNDPVPHAEVAARAARALGVPESDLLLQSKPRDTEEEARTIKETVGSAPFVVVTSAAHLPRAMGLLRKLGLAPIPAPADVTSGKAPGLHLGDLFPAAENVRRVESAIHEYLGLIWSGLRGAS